MGIFGTSLPLVTKISEPRGYCRDINSKNTSLLISFNLKDVIIECPIRYFILIRIYFNLVYIRYFAGRNLLFELTSNTWVVKDKNGF